MTNVILLVLIYAVIGLFLFGCSSRTNEKTEIKSLNFEKDGKLFLVSFFNYFSILFIKGVSYLVSVYLFSTDGLSAPDFTLMTEGLLFWLNVSLSTVTVIYLVKMKYKTIPAPRALYRISFFYGIIFVPTWGLGFIKLDLLCLGLFLSFICYAIINRVFRVNLPSNKISIRIPNDVSSFLMDTLRFRSEFSLNNPGGHRQTFEEFYPYCAILSLFIFLGISMLSNQQTVSIYSLLTTPDGTIFANFMTPPKNSEPMVCKDTEDRNPASEKNQALLDYVYQNQQRYQDGIRKRGPNSNESQSFNQQVSELVMVRNFIFFLLIFSSIWLLNAKSRNNAYVDKWKTLDNEWESLILQSDPSIRNQLKIKFARNLIVMEMWGHRSFENNFYEILKSVPYKDDVSESLFDAIQAEKIDSEELLDELSKPNIKMI